MAFPLSSGETMIDESFLGLGNDPHAGGTRPRKLSSKVLFFGERVYRFKLLQKQHIAALFGKTFFGHFSLGMFLQTSKGESPKSVVIPCLIKPY
jgi:hypothetical protein